MGMIKDMLSPPFQTWGGYITPTPPRFYALVTYSNYFKYQLDKYLSTIPDTPCIANYDNSLENSSHTNPHLLTGVHPV